MKLSINKNGLHETYRPFKENSKNYKFFKSFCILFILFENICCFANFIACSRIKAFNSVFVYDSFNWIPVAIRLSLSLFGAFSLKFAFAWPAVSSVPPFSAPASTNVFGAS